MCNNPLCKNMEGSMFGLEGRMDSTKYQQSLNANVVQPVKKVKLK